MSPFQRIILPFLLVAAILGSISAFFSQSATSEKETNAEAPVPTIVLDAGHGGEDGGTVSESGILEKELNLQIANRLCDLLTASGYSVVMTRTEDTLLYDKNSDYEGKKKTQDLQARRKIAEETENAVFVSIHMNSYPDPRFSGLQVWYSPNHPSSKALANMIQEEAKNRFQPENERQTKAATSAIYLLKHLNIPAVLVECGFLSNVNEAQKLTTSEYQEQIALTVYLALENAFRQSAIPYN